METGSKSVDTHRSGASLYEVIELPKDSFRVLPSFTRFAGNANRRVLWQGVRRKGSVASGGVIAVFCWAGAKPRRERRDLWLDWNPDVRDSRHSQVIELRQFHAFENRFIDMKLDLLRLATDGLQAQWEEAFMVRPLLAECCDSQIGMDAETLMGAGWRKLGVTPDESTGNLNGRNLDAGFLWILELSRRAKTTLAKPLTRAASPVELASSRTMLIEGFRCLQMKKLVRQLCCIKDPRGRQSRIYPIGSILAIICLSRMSGNVCGKEHTRWAHGLSQRHRRAIGLKAVDPGGVLRIPSHDTFTDLINLLSRNRDNEAKVTIYFNEWLKEQKQPPFSYNLW